MTPSQSLTAPASTASSNGNDSNVEYNNASFSYCFLESQNWMGVDIVAPDCTSDANNILCTDPDAANRIVSFKS